MTADDRSTRLDRAVSWTGAGAATALAAVLMMFGAWGLEGSAPRADNVGETGISLAMGGISLLLSLGVSVSAGMVLGRRAARGRGWLRALPVLVSVVWLTAAAILMFSGVAGVIVELGWRSSAFAGTWSFFVLSVYTVGAIPIGLGLFAAWIVLVVIRASTRPSRGRTEPSAPPAAGA